MEKLPAELIEHILSFDVSLDAIQVFKNRVSPQWLEREYIKYMTNCHVMEFKKIVNPSRQLLDRLIEKSIDPILKEYTTIDCRPTKALENIGTSGDPTADVLTEYINRQQEFSTNIEPFDEEFINPEISDDPIQDTEIEIRVNARQNQNLSIPEYHVPPPEPEETRGYDREVVDKRLQEYNDYNTDAYLKSIDKYTRDCVLSYKIDQVGMGGIKFLYVPYTREFILDGLYEQMLAISYEEMN